MSLKSTPSGERVHIDMFGMTYADKASIINALTNQEKRKYLKFYQRQMLH
ncbi:hypothetical protein [Clostridium gelidum]|nr:hypothetical protein [Clostridium gelidum]